MDLDDLRSILRTSDVDIWTFIETSIDLASLDYGEELKYRRDGIVGKLYREIVPLCRNCDNNDIDRQQQQMKSTNGFKSRPSNSPFTAEGRERERENDCFERNIDSPLTPVGEGEEDAAAEELEEGNELDLTPDHGIGIVEEKRRILAIKEQFEEPHQSEESLIELLQSLADMDITFQALKETDIGRYVNRLRKHYSSDVKRLVKVLVRKWKDLVDEWVRLNGEPLPSALIEGDSPLQHVSRNQQNGHHQVPDFGYSPNPHNGSAGSGSEKNNLEYEPASRMKTAPARREPPCRASLQNNGSSSQSAPPPNRQKEVVIDPEKLASARKRLQENYQEAQNARKQRTIQVMDIHDIPKPKNRNAFFPRNKGGFQGRH